MIKLLTIIILKIISLCLFRILIKLNERNIFLKMLNQICQCRVQEYVGRKIMMRIDMKEHVYILYDSGEMSWFCRFSLSDQCFKCAFWTIICPLEAMDKVKSNLKCNKKDLSVMGNRIYFVEKIFKILH